MAEVIKVFEVGAARHEERYLLGRNRRLVSFLSVALPRRGPRIFFPAVGTNAISHVDAVRDN